MPSIQPPQFAGWSSTVKEWKPFDQKPGANYVRDHIPIPGTDKFLKVTVFIDQKTLLRGKPEDIEAKLDLATRTLLAAWQLAPTTKDGEFDKIHLKSFDSSTVHYWKGEEKVLKAKLRDLVREEPREEGEDGPKITAYKSLKTILQDWPPEKVSTLRQIINLASKILPQRNEEFLEGARVEPGSAPPPVPRPGEAIAAAPPLILSPRSGRPADEDERLSESGASSRASSVSDLSEEAPLVPPGVSPSSSPPPRREPMFKPEPPSVEEIE